MAALCALKIKAIKKPKKYVCSTGVATNPHQQLLDFIATVCAGRNFPAKRVEWNKFCMEHGAQARDKGVRLPKLTKWNQVRKSRQFDVLADLKDARKWWSIARLHHNLLSSTKAPPESIKSASMSLLVCPTTVPLIVKYLRVEEVLSGYQSRTPRDWYKGTHRCPKCHKFAVPICFAKPSATKCVNMECHQVSTHSRTSANTCTHSSTSTNTHAQVQVQTHAPTHTQSQTHALTYTHTHTHTHSLTHSLTHTHVHAHTYTAHARHKCMHTQALTHAQAQTHALTQCPLPLPHLTHTRIHSQLYHASILTLTSDTHTHTHTHTQTLHH